MAEISIVMATFNRSHLIAESLESIQNQTYLNWECLVIDDGSTDETESIVQKLSGVDQRIRYFRRDQNFQKGLPGCRNMGIANASGKYVLFFDDDDLLHPEAMECCYKTLANSKREYCRFQREVFSGEFEKELKLRQEYEVNDLDNVLEDMLTEKIPFNSCQVMWELELLKQNNFNESLMYAEEWECYARILMDGAKGLNISRTLLYARKHMNSNTGEYVQGNQIRRKSHIVAMKIVIETLYKTNYLSATLQKHFLRYGFNLKNFEIISLVLQYSNLNGFQKLKYKLGFVLYPVIKPLLKWKQKITHS